MKSRHIGAAIALAILLPFAASALSVDDIQQQIRNLLAQVTQLQEQLRSLQNNQPIIACTQEAKICPDGTAVGRTGLNCEFAACPSGVKPLPPTCPTFTRTLAQGATGNDVTQLQQYLGVSPTGYFGPMTAKAVAAVQADAGLSQVGIVGPATRAWFYKRCGGGGWNQNFIASPTSGTAPLQVVFNARSAPGVSVSSYSVDFGDGDSEPMFNNAPQPYAASTGLDYSSQPPVTPMGAIHTYTSNGTYTAKLIYQPPAPPCNAPPGAACMTVMPPSQIVGTATIQVGGMTSTGAPSVTGVDGPASLATGQSGTWTVRASVPNNPNAQLRYSVIWGDESVLGTLNAFAGATAPTLQTSASFTHVYARAGTYRPTFTVANDAGSAQTSASVVVGGTTNDSNFSASPTSGNAPLSVQFTARNGSRIDYGDGEEQQFPPVQLGSGPFVYTHIYKTSGTYTATHYGNGPEINKVTITVGGSTSANFSAYPTSGAAPLTVTFAGNVGNFAGSGAIWLEFGDGSGTDFCPPPRAVPCGQGSKSHTYSTSGTYNAKLVHYLEGPATVLGTVTITVTGSGCVWSNYGQNCKPIISSITPASGPAGQAYPIRATISGMNITTTGTTVHFGPVTISDVSANGVQGFLSFDVPKLMPSGGEVPPMVLQPGDYNVYVTNANGTSNTLTFTLTR